MNEKCHKHTKPWQDVPKADCPYCRIAELESQLAERDAEIKRLREALEYIANEEETIGWLYAAKIAKAALAQEGEG